MKTERNKQKRQGGIALVIALVFVTVFSTLSVAMFTLSSNNILVAENVHQVNIARDCAQSGLEILRYHAERVTLAGTTTPSQRYAVFAASLESDLATLFDVCYDSAANQLTIGSAGNLVDLTGTADKGFYARLIPDGTTGVTILVTGKSGHIERTLSGGFSYAGKSAHVFDYGVATKGPLHLGNLLLDGVSHTAQSNIYIESLNTVSALSLQNGQVAGEVYIANPNATVSMSGGQSSIGGESGVSAVDNHVQTGVTVTEFPVPDPTYFEQYVDGITIDSSTDKNFYKESGTLENVRIAANTDPKFTGNIQITGILYIESPNTVEFGGTCEVTGIIVAAGDYTDNSGDNELIFRGNVGSQSVTELPADARYDGLREETGIFLMAPGFTASFGGNFHVLNGSIIANGIVFFGNAGGQIDGSIVNYSDETMELSGGDILFNRGESSVAPAGFIPDIEMRYNPGSYEEIH